MHQGGQGVRGVGDQLADGGVGGVATWRRRAVGVRCRLRCRRHEVGSVRRRSGWVRDHVESFQPAPGSDRLANLCRVTQTRWHRCCCCRESATRSTATRTAVDALLGNRTLRRRSADVSAESSLRGAWASAWLSGAAASAGRGAVRGRGRRPDRARGAARVRRHRVADRHLDPRAAPGAGPAARAGRGRPRDRPRHAGAAASGQCRRRRLDTLAGVLSTTRRRRSSWQRSCTASCLTLDAFAPASGVVARVAVRLTLIERGLDPKSLVVDRGRPPRTAERSTTAAAVPIATGTPEGIASWIATAQTPS